MQFKIGLYARISKLKPQDKNNPEKNMSIEDQLARLRKFIHAQYPGLPFKEFVDPGKTGGSIKRRPEMKEFISHAKRGDINVLVVWDDFRSFRKASDCQYVDDLLQERGGYIHFAKSGIKTNTAQGKRITNIMAAVSEGEREDVIERLRDAYKTRMLRGIRMVAKIPTGYNRDEKTRKLVVNREEAKLVKLVYKYYLRTGSINRTAEHVNALGYKTKVFGPKIGGKPWTASSIKIMLHNLIYTGKAELYKSNKSGKKKESAHEEKQYQILEDRVFPQIIDDKTYQQVQDMLKLNRETRSSSILKRGRPYLLNAGLLKCECRRNFYGTSAGTGKSIFYYRSNCSCHYKMLRADDTEELVFNKVSELVKANPDILKGIVSTMKEKTEEKIREIEAELANRDSRVKGLKAEQDGLIRALMNATDENKHIVNERLKEVTDKLNFADGRMEKAYLQILRNEINDLVEETWVDEVQDKLNTLKSIRSLEPGEAKRLLKTIFKEILYCRDHLKMYLNCGDTFNISLCADDTLRQQNNQHTISLMINCAIV